MLDKMDLMALMATNNNRMFQKDEAYFENQLYFLDRLFFDHFSPQEFYNEKQRNYLDQRFLAFSDLNKTYFLNFQLKAYSMPGAAVAGPAKFPARKFEKVQNAAQNYAIDHETKRDNFFTNTKKELEKLTDAHQEFLNEQKKFCTEFRFDEKGITIKYNYTRIKQDANAPGYIEIYHDEKPEREEIQEIKKNGFRWSPRGKCWGRQLTRNAVIKTIKFLELDADALPIPDHLKSEIDKSIDAGGLFEVGKIYRNPENKLAYYILSRTQKSMKAIPFDPESRNICYADQIMIKKDDAGKEIIAKKFNFSTNDLVTLESLGIKKITKKQWSNEIEIEWISDEKFLERKRKKFDFSAPAGEPEPPKPTEPAPQVKSPEVALLEKYWAGEITKKEYQDQTKEHKIYTRKKDKQMAFF
ncbi:MAG: hypothetical protein LBV67_04525 [Streptococcaceae bacterium]|nr:hypothetical protein [Streptococcaceae bacterium]